MTKELGRILIRETGISPTDSIDEICNSIRRIIHHYNDIHLAIASIKISGQEEMTTIEIFYAGEDEKEYIKHCILPSDILGETIDTIL